MTPFPNPRLLNAIAYLLLLAGVAVLASGWSPATAPPSDPSEAGHFLGGLSLALAALLWQATRQSA